MDYATNVIKLKNKPNGTPLWSAPSLSNQGDFPHKRILLHDLPIPIDSETTPSAPEYDPSIVTAGHLPRFLRTSECFFQRYAIVGGHIGGEDRCLICQSKVQSHRTPDIEKNPGLRGSDS